MDDREAITILIPIKNGYKFVFNAINYIQSNISAEDEVLVIDDGSTDGTSDLLADWQKRNSNVKILTGSSSGLVDALNLGLRHASHKWVARFDVDDKYLSNRLFEQRKWINGDIALIFSDYEVSSDTDSSLGTIHGAIFHPAVSLSLITSSRTPHPGAVLNRSIALEAGGYRTADFPAEDLSLWLRMSRFGKLVSVPLPLLIYKIHNGSITSNRNEEMKSKTKGLMNNIGISSKDLMEVKLTWKEIYGAYGFFSHSGERRILFLRDLISLYRLNPELIWLKIAILHISIKLFCNPLLAPKILRMRAQKKARFRKRKFF